MRIKMLLKVSNGRFTIPDNACCTGLEPSKMVGCSPLQHDANSDGKSNDISTSFLVFMIYQLLYLID